MSSAKNFDESRLYGQWIVRDSMSVQRQVMDHFDVYRSSDTFQEGQLYTFKEDG